MRRSLFVAIVLAVLAWAAPAQAITYGVPDGNGHPNVGGLVSPEQYSDGTWIYCSGTLISPTVFLTAAHCAEDGERVAVTFDPAYEDGDRVYTGTFHADPRTGSARATRTTSRSSCSTSPSRGSHRRRCPRPGR